MDNLEEAIETLSEIGADQTMSVGADHKQFMAAKEGAGLLGLPYALRQAGWAGNIGIMLATYATCYTAKVSTA